MKRFAFLFLLILAAAGVRAQEMGVESIRPDMMDMTAATYPRHDLNGKPCAVVKVRMPEGAAFEGNVIGSTEYRTGEYWVYMTAGTKFLRVKHATARPLHIAFADHGIPQLESKATYILDITMPAAATPAQSAASGRNYAVFTVEPPTATVTIEGAAHEARAGKVNVLLRHGVHAYTVEAPGYLPERGSVTVGARRAELSVRLRSAKGTIAVTCATPGTEIYVNGDRVGSGTWQGEFAPGEYLVEGRLASHRPVEQLATVVMGEKCTVALPALSAITGSLDVNFEPNGATISIDGTARGTTPAMLDGVLAGTNSLTISATGYTPQTHTVTIADSQTASLSGSLSKAAAPAPAHTNNASSAQPFSLCAQAPDGSIVYFTADEWKALSYQDQSRYKKKGVVLSGKGKKFLVELEDAEGGKGMEWKKALKYNLPTKEQGPVMADNKAALNNALRAFGGTVMDSWYWTKTEDSSALAWYVGMYYGSVHTSNKTDTGRVRAVAPVPVASAI